MAKHKADKILDDYLRGSSSLSRLYGSEALAGPPASLDRRILHAARDEVRGHRGFNPFAGKWYVPLSAAAVIAIAIGLTVFMQQEGVTPVSSFSPEQVEQLKPGMAASDESISSATTPAKRRLEKADASAERAKSKMTDANDAPAAFAPAPKAVDERAAEPASSPSTPGLLAAGAARQEKKENDMTGITADVTAVRVTGQENAYQFSVTVRSQDTGCQQYADWWEVLDESGKLLYRRVLLHSHVGEQPFTRGGGPVPVDANTTVIVRAHMNTAGYGGAALKGSVKQGFAKVTLPAGFAANVAGQSPLPDGCMF